LLPEYWKCPSEASHQQLVTKEEVAYHESGHAVIAHLLGVAIDYATIVPNGTIAGQVRYTITLDKLPPSQQVMITLAGPIAEDMVTASPRFVTFDDLMSYSESDGWGVLRVVNLYKDEVDIPGHYDVAKYLINKHRDAIEAVAKSLMKHKKLFGEAIVAMIDETRKGIQKK
jgi:ATP-dependent Zn protease